MENSDPTSQPIQPTTPPREEAADFSSYLAQKPQEGQKSISESGNTKNSLKNFFKGHPMVITTLLIVFIFSIIIFFFSFMTFNNKTMKLPPGAKIINEPGQPPRLETPILP